LVHFEFRDSLWHTSLEYFDLRILFGKRVGSNLGHNL
jgi:hypothetical protein